MQPATHLDDAWSATASDVPRRMRLLASGVLAALAMAAVAAGVASLPVGLRQTVAQEEEPLEVALVERPEEPAPPELPPPPEAAAEPPPPDATPPAPGPRAAPVAAPLAAPTSSPKEAEPSGESPPPGSPTEGEGAGGTDPRGTGAASPPAPPPPAPPAPRAAGPVRVTDDVEPPKPLSMGSPAYPAAARSAGIEGTVVIAYVVDAGGAVSEARVVRGPPELAAACLATVRAWRFSPAMSGGRPVAVRRSARFPFRLRT